MQRHCPISPNDSKESKLLFVVVSAILQCLVRTELLTRSLWTIFTCGSQDAGLGTTGSLLNINLNP